MTNMKFVNAYSKNMYYVHKVRLRTYNRDIRHIIYII